MSENTNFSIKAEIRDTSFKLLMRDKINYVLLVCSDYDAFILEEDGRIDEQIFNEYSALNLNYPPQFIHVSTTEETLEVIKNKNIDLVILMQGIEQTDFQGLALEVKDINNKIPIVVLSPFSKTIQSLLDQQERKEIDYVFNWQGNIDILLAIIKLIEDTLNVEHDVFEVGLQAILLVEDSVKYYSMYLGLMYKLLFKQSKTFVTEGLNEHQKMLRLRGRPKILLATNYEDAISLYEKYKYNLLGVISDVKFKKDGAIDPIAGIKLCKKIRNYDPNFSLILQSSNAKYEKDAKKLDAGFVCKESNNIPSAFTTYFKENFSFGDFIIRDAETHKEIDRANNLRSLQQKIFQINDESFAYHLKNNDFTKWLNARALFPIANVFKYLTPNNFPDIDYAKKFLYDTISEYRMNKLRGMIAEYNRTTFDDYFVFSRIGDGSIGGKARGLAFLDNLIMKYKLIHKYEGVVISIPRTVVITTEIFDEFMEINNLYDIAYSDKSDDEILNRFVNAHLPTRIHKDMLAFVSVIKKPIAIRSSSLLEDSLYQPFAGVYSTYMLPYSTDDVKMVFFLSQAIKSVYASVYFKASKSYMTATSNLINEEKMAIILQEICGNSYNDMYYPTISGVARSINYYPIGDEKPEDGIANIAMGLGGYLMNGGMGLRFSPAYPKKVLQLSSVKSTLKETQKEFYGLNLDLDKYEPSTNDGVNITSSRIKHAPDSVLKFVASKYDYNNEIIVNGIRGEGMPLITFSNILNYNSFPLADIIKTFLNIGKKAFNNPVEIEFAINLDKCKDGMMSFNVLQIRPIVESKENYDVNLDKITKEKILIYSDHVLGNGLINGLKDVVFVKPEAFNLLKSKEISLLIEKLNDKFIKTNKKYILIGPGRWGSSDPSLGIPVEWYQISNAKVIVESGLENYRVDPSQGTHFFHNLTALEVAYFTINPFINDGSYNVEFLSNIEPEYEDEFLKHVKFSKALQVKINGKENKGVILKP